jgi:hypothetical protein
MIRFAALTGEKATLRSAALIASAFTARAIWPRQAARRTVSAPPGGSLGTGDLGDSGTLAARR